MTQLIISSNLLKTTGTKALAKQKDEVLAAYYTPSEVAQILTDWAIVSPDACVLDPSYGGCSFLESAQKTLIGLGNRHPEGQIFGVDIDQDATTNLEALISSGAKSRQFITEDFFEIGTMSFKRQFNAVVGNPPYLRFHSIPKSKFEVAERRLKEFGITLSGRSSYWAYFLLYSIQFLLPGGRLAMVLPGAFLHTDYSTQVREQLIRHFRQVNIFLLQERIFDGTQEESIIICAQGAHLENETVQLSEVATVDDLSREINKPQLEIDSPLTHLGNSDLLRNILEKDISHLYDDLSSESSVLKLGEWVNSRIGVVTGNNGYFIMSEQDRIKREIPIQYVLPVIKRPSYVTGFIANNRELVKLKQQGKDCLLFYPPADLSHAPESVQKYIKDGEVRKVHLAWKCKSRKPWYVVPHVEPPSAFIPCMAASWTRIVVNKSNFTCTNNILKLSWKLKRPAGDWIRLALGSLSTFSQLSSELVGRSYGGGILKLEPTELSRLQIPLIQIEDAKIIAEPVNKLLKLGLLEEATSLVDEALLKANPAFSAKNIKKIRDARNKLYLRRRQHIRNANKILR